MPSAALLAVTPPPSKEEKRRKRRLLPPAIKQYGRGQYGTGSIPAGLCELADLLDHDRRIPEGCALDPRVLGRVRKALRAINALGNRPAND